MTIRASHYILKDKHIAIKGRSLTQKDLTEHVTLTGNGNITRLNKYKIQTATLRLPAIIRLDILLVTIVVLIEIDLNRSLSGVAALPDKKV